MTKVAVVTGSNKGIGFALVKGLLKRFDGAVYLTSRNEEKGKEAILKLNALGLKPEYHQLDITDCQSISKFRDHIIEKYEGLDILVNNAAIANTQNLYNSYEECKKIIETDYYSILNIQEIIYPLMKDNGRILNISSDCGHLCNLRNEYWIKRLSNKDLTVSDINAFVSWYLEGMKKGTFNNDDLADGGTIAPYRVAKMALSAMTKVQQKDVETKNISINSMHPGLVRTDMTSGIGFYNADQAAETPLYLVLDAPQSLKGAYVWYDRKELDWYDYKADYFFKSKHFKRE